jgi:polyisoprenoid-binding protein YceI
MMSDRNVETPYMSTKRRIEHEAEGGASGALVGAIVGASAGPPGAIAGAIIGGVAGALAAAVMDQESSARAQETRELDEVPAEEPPAEGVNFWMRNLMIGKVNGRFTRWRGSLVFDGQAPQNSRVEVEIDAASIDTKDALRDAHLRSADFFDVEKYPKLVFESTKVERVGDNFKVTGDLTMHGITKPVTLDVEYADRAKHPPIRQRAGFFAHGSLSRRDWGLTWNQSFDAGRLALGDRIEIHLGILATKAS